MESGPFLPASVEPVLLSQLEFAGDFSDFVDYEAFEPIYDASDILPVGQELQSLSYPAWEPYCSHSTPADPALGDLTCSELDTAPHYPSELDLGPDFLDFDPQHETENWLESNLGAWPQCEDLEALSPVTDEPVPSACRPSATGLTEAQLGRCSQEADAGCGFVDAKEENIEKPARVPSKEEAADALNLVAQYLNSQSDTPIIEPHVPAALELLTSKLREPPKRRRGSSGLSERTSTAKIGRATISASTRKVLEEQFEIDPYLNIDVIKRLSSKTGLSRKSLQNWFANNRSRRDSIIRK
jgi:hypothetical protein